MCHSEKSHEAKKNFGVNFADEKSSATDFFPIPTRQKKSSEKKNERIKKLRLKLVSRCGVFAPSMTSGTPKKSKSEKKP